MYKKLVAIVCALLYGVVTERAAENRIILKPGPEGVDTWFGSVYNAQGVNNDILRIGGWGDYYDTLIKFDGATQSLPGTFKRAELWLYGVNITRPTNMRAWLLTTRWSETSWDHQNLMGYYIGEYPGPQVGSGWYGLNVTTSVDYWRQNPSWNYGWYFAPAANDNRFDEFYSSDSTSVLLRPQLHLVYDGPSVPTIPDTILRLKWPLATPYASRVVTQPFGANWAGNIYCDGLIKKHNGTDFRASAGTVVYAAEEGVVKEVTYDRSGLWASNIVLEHNHPNGGKYTTVCWHVNPSLAVGNSVQKGMPIATVADLQANTHFHFGVRIGSYSSAYLNTTPYAGTGALPQTNCGGYPAFPSGFIDPNNTSSVLFQ